MPSPTPPVNKCPFRLATLKGNYLPFRHNAFALFISLSFFFALPSALYPQPYLFDARMLTAEDGLSNLTVSSVYKDKQGFIWIGNLYGLDRYDGYNFKLFTREESALYPHSYIARIAEDEEGRLWLFYRNGNSIPPSPEAISAIDIFDPKTGRAVPFDAFFSGAAPFSTADVYFPKILDPRNRLWIHTNKGELFLYQNGRFKKVFQMEGAFFQYITIDEEENIWLGWKNNLLAIDLSGNVLEKRTLPGQVLGAWAGPDGAIWISTQDTEDKQAAIWRRPETGPLIPFNLVRDNRPVEVEEVHPFLHLNQNGYWFAIIEGQLNLFGPQGNWLYNYSDLLGQPLIEVSSLSYFEDVGLLWLPSATGVFKASIRPNPFQIIHKKDTILSDCRGIAEDEQGNIYFLNSYLYQWNSNTRKCTKISDIEGAYALLYTDSMLWSGSYGGDIAGCQFSLRSNEKTYYMPLNPDGHLALSLAPTGRPHQYLAGFNVGLACLDLEQQKLLSYEEYDPNYKRDSVLEQSEVDFIHKNAFGYWLATNNGIFLLKEGKGVIRHYDRSNG
ncbi:MAG: hypothetical protein H6564_24725, partial [Lewinellaceae bacterium]|nr:hypothetical protein [Lewinellaceae bacterium]